MSGFDDLIPKLSGTSNPILDNPFADPFADVGRPRSPDPWSTAASFYQQQQQQQQPAQPDDPYANPYADETPFAALSYHDEAIITNTLTAQTRGTELFVSHSEKGVEHSATEEVDPLDAPSVSVIEEPVQPRGTFAPLPAIKASPKMVPTVISPPGAPENAAPPSPSSTLQMGISSSLEEKSVPPALSEPGTPKTPLAPTDTSYATENKSAHLPTGEQDSLRIGSDEPVAEPSKSPFSSASPDTTSPSLPGPSKSSFQMPPHPPSHQDFTSPLTSPAPRYQSNALALGGEAPGWGSVASPPPYPLPGARIDFGRPAQPTPDDDDDDKPLAATLESKLAIKTEQTKPQLMFTITVGDPQKVGDPISAHIVYTVTTKTNHPAFKKDSFSVLRRYSDFLWLYETLVSNNPGIIVPPVPEKVALGRFEGSFVESRRLALNKCIQKIANHAKLANDLDFIFFLESDTFSLDIKHRRAESSTGGFLASLGSSISGSKFHETDEWFDKKKTYLDTLEAQLRSLVKAIEAVAKQRTEVITATQEFADTIAALAASDLSKHLSESMKVLAQVETQAKELHDSQARDDLVLLTGTVDEYIRLITSVRLAFQSRTKTYHNMKLTESERLRVRNANEKIIRQHTVDRQSMVPLQREIEQVELKAQEARTKFEEVTRLCKAEVDRFERERINDFKISLERFLDGMLRRQNEIIDSWDGYQKLLLKSTDLNNEAPTAA